MGSLTSIDPFTVFLTQHPGYLTHLEVVFLLDAIEEVLCIIGFIQPFPFIVREFHFDDLADTIVEKYEVGAFHISLSVFC